VPAGKVVADKAYDARDFIDAIHAQGGQAVIPPRATSQQPREFDAHVYKGRNLVERLFNRIRHFRRVATRDDTLDGRYEAFVHAAAALILLA
jgi:transposase